MESPEHIGPTQKIGFAIEEARRKSRHLVDAKYFRREASFYKRNSWTSRIRHIFLVSSIPLISRSVFRSHYGILQERIRQMTTFPWILHPYSTFRWVWNILMTMFLLTSLVIQPIFVAFYSDVKNGYNVEVSCILSSVFFLDILLTLRTGYVCKSTDAIVLDYTYVAKKYLKTWLLIDILSSIPYDVIYFVARSNLLVTEENTFFFKCFRILELLNIFRLVRVLRYLTSLQETIGVNMIYIRIVNLITFIFLMVHWLACLHYLAADLFKTDYTVKEFSWVTRMNLWNTTVGFRYVNCVIRSLSNMGCLGYGLEVPLETEDIICTILSILMGATCFALFTGNLTSLLLHVGFAEKQYGEHLNQVQEYMRFKQIPRDLQSRVIMYYEQRYRHNFFNEQQILSTLSDVLRKQLQMHSCRHLVEQVPLFHGLPQTIIEEIVSHLKFEVYFPPDAIISALTLGDCMFFIEHGGVSVIDTKGHEVSRLGDGDFFGELGLLTNERRAASVIAINFCEVYRLERADFESTIANYPDIHNSIIKMVEDRMGISITHRLKKKISTDCSLMDLKFETDRAK